MTGPRLCLCRFHTSSHVPHVLLIHTDDLQPRSLFARKMGNTCYATATEPAFCQKIPPTTLKNKRKLIQHPSGNQMIFNQKISVTLDVFFGTIFQIFFSDIRNPTQANPPSVQRKPRWPQLLRSKGPRGPTGPHSRKNEGGKVQRKQRAERKRRNTFCIYAVFWLVVCFNPFEKYSIPGSPTTIF